MARKRVFLWKKTEIFDSDTKTSLPNSRRLSPTFPGACRQSKPKNIGIDRSTEMQGACVRGMRLEETTGSGIFKTHQAYSYRQVREVRTSKRWNLVSKKSVVEMLLMWFFLSCLFPTVNCSLDSVKSATRFGTLSNSSISQRCETFSFTPVHF